MPDSDIILVHDAPLLSDKDVPKKCVLGNAYRHSSLHAVITQNIYFILVRLMY